MTSKIKVDNISDQNDNNIINESGDVITVGAAGDTVAVAGNVVKTNAVQAADAGNLISQSGTTITLGASGDTINVASGATLVGGGIDWQSSVVTAATHTAADKTREKPKVTKKFRHTQQTHQSQNQNPTQTR